MEFSATELYIKLPLAFVVSDSLLAIRKVLPPVDYFYRQYTRDTIIGSPARLPNLNEATRPATESNRHTSTFLGKLPTEIRQTIYRIYYEHSRSVLTREGTLPSKHIAWMHDKDWR